MEHCLGSFNHCLDFDFMFPLLCWVLGAYSKCDTVEKNLEACNILIFSTS